MDTEGKQKHTISGIRERQQQQQQPNIDSSSATSSYTTHRRDGSSHPPPARSPDYSPAKSPIASDVSSLSHGLSPEREEPLGSPPPADPSPKPPSTVPVVNRYVRDATEAVKMTNRGAQDGFVGGAMESEGGGGRRFRAPTAGRQRTVEEAVVKKAALGFRIFGFLFCLVSLSVMAADKNEGWALDSFYRYKEFRYCMSVNAIGFVYAGLQGCYLAFQLAAGNFFFDRRHLRYYLDFAVDQMLTYLLISASSTAATRVEDWESNWGKDKFPDMAKASVGVSFVAFVAFAFSSLISGYTLYASKST